MTTPHRQFDTEAVKAAIPFSDLVAETLGELQKVSNREFSTLCPFHSEDTPSFTIYPDHGHCFGCGWHGDIFAFYQEVHGVSFVEAYDALEAKAGLGNGGTGELRKIEIKSRTATKAPPKKPITPSFRALRPPEIKQLANLRGLDPLALRVAAQDYRKVGYCDWPQWQRKGDGKWMAASEIGPSWVVTDDDRWVVQYRRFNGEKYHIHRPNGHTDEIKAWTKGSARWPVGCGQIGDTKAVLFCEGGTDMLAAYHFLFGFELLDEVAVVAMLGSPRIADDALPFFAGKRVRIMMDADEPKPDKNGVLRRPGWENAQRWQGQLTAAGAAVECFSLEGLKTAAGDVVGDLNDLAYCDARTLDSDEIREAFFAWDF